MTLRRIALVLLAAAAGCSSDHDDSAAPAANPAPGAAGVPDTSFDTDGIAVVPVGTEAYGGGVAIQSDGKIVVAGSAKVGPTFDFAVLRFNPDGSLDSSFDADGIATASVGAYNDYALALALQSDGKIVLAGQAYNGTDSDFAVARFNSDGTLDSSFDADGRVVTPFGSGNDFGNAVAIQADGKIVVAGDSHNGTNFDFAVARYDAGGALDPSFDSDGRVSTPVGGSDDRANAVAIQSDGKIIVVGTNTSPGDFAVVRYDVDGSLDGTLDSDGIVTTSISGFLDKAEAVTMQPDGRIVVAGESFMGSTYDLAVVRYLSDGSLDASFDGDGRAVLSDPGNEIASSVLMQPDGKIVVAGYADGAMGFDIALFRYNGDGSLDASFDSDGWLTTAVGDEDYGVSAALQSDDRIVVAGYTSLSVFSGGQIVVARYR